LFRQAVRLGLLQRKHFVLNKRNYKNRVTLSRFRKYELLPLIKISEEDLIAAYEKDRDTFEQATNVVVSMFTFDNITNAFRGKYELVKLGEFSTDDLEENLKKQGFLKGLKDYKLNYTIGYEAGRFPEAVMNELFALEDGGFNYFPVEGDGYFKIFRRERASGSRIKSFDEGKDLLEKKLRSEKLDELKRDLVRRVRGKFPIENNIDYSRYLDPSFSFTEKTAG